MQRTFALAFLTLAACTPAPAPAPEQAAVVEQPATPAPQAETPAAPAEAAEKEGDDAVQCMTFIRLEADALSKATPPGDTAALDHAYAAWKTRAEAHFTPDELAQFFASNVAVMDDTAPAEIKTKADACVTQVPAPASTP